MRRDFGHVLIVLVLVAVNAIAQIPVSPTQAPNVTPQGPQRHNPPSQPQQQSGVWKTAPAPVTTLHAAYTGTVEGLVYWDYSEISHKSPNACSDLSVTVSVGTAGGQFKPLATLNNNFKYIGRAGTYAVCTYAFDKVPVGPDLKVKVDVTNASAFLPISAPVPDIPRAINIINGKCNSLPPAAPSPSDLTANWWTCGNFAYNVNFALQPSATIRSASSKTGLLSASSSNQATLLSSEPKKGMLEGSAPGAQPQAAGTVPVNTPGSKVELNPQPLPPGGKISSPTYQKSLTNTDVIKMVKAGVPESVVISTVQSGGKNFDFSPTGCRLLRAARVSESVLNAMGDGSVRPCIPEGTAGTSSAGSTVELNPQPYPPRLASGAVSGTAGAASGKRVEPIDPKLTLKLRPGVVGQQIKNPRIAQLNKATLALQKQRSFADVEAAQMKLSLRPELQTATLTGPSRTMSSGAMGTATASTAQAPASLAMNNGTTAPGPGNISPAITHLPHINTTVITCANDPTFRILTVSGSAGQATFTPIDAYNLYTITGCSFGNQDPKNKVYIYGAGTFQANFNIKFWNDNSIVVSLDPTISGFPDLANITLVIQRQDQQQAQKGGFKFYAARATVPLRTLPSAWAQLQTFPPAFTAEYSSPPSMTGTLGASVQTTISATAFVGRFANGTKFDVTSRASTCNGPTDCRIPNTDTYDFSGLASGWTTDSFQVTTYSQICPYDVTYKQDFGKWNWDWDFRNPNNILIGLSDTTCSGVFPPMPWMNYQNWTGSYYSLQVWVSGPRGLDPLTNQRVSQ